MRLRKTISIPLTFSLLVISITGCQKNFYNTNGESIYRSGRNMQGETMLDKSRSSITLFRSCQSCHGPSGDRMKHTLITYAGLSNPALYPVPYNDSMIVRFLDHDLKSDGRKANIGVRWKMSEQDKKDLIEFIKKL